MAWGLSNSAKTLNALSNRFDFPPKLRAMTHPFEKFVRDVGATLQEAARAMGMSACDVEAIVQGNRAPSLQQARLMVAYSGEVLALSDLLGAGNDTGASEAGSASKIVDVFQYTEIKQSDLNTELLQKRLREAMGDQFQNLGQEDLRILSLLAAEAINQTFCALSVLKDHSREDRLRLALSSVLEQILQEWRAFDLQTSLSDPNRAANLAAACLGDHQIQSRLLAR